MNKINWKQKLSSRKFWAAVGGFVSGEQQSRSCSTRTRVKKTKPR